MVSLNRPFFSYDPESFVDRETEIALVAGLARKLVEGGRKTGQPRAITIRGERGSGKTWLSLYLHRQELPKIPGVVTLLISLVPMFTQEYRPWGREPEKGEYFDIAPDIQKDQQKNEELYKESYKRVLVWISTVLGTTIAPHVTLDELSNWLARDLAQRQQVFIFILDSIFEMDWGYLKDLESFFIAPLAALPNTIFVMTGRGKLYPWISPYLRVEVEERQLESFKENNVAEQIQRQAPNTKLSPEQIKKIGGGHPLNNFLLATASDWTTEIDTIIDLLLDIKSGRCHPIIRDYFEALCALDGFREEEIPYMLAAYYEDPKREKMPITDVRKMRDEMIATNLVRWENSKFIVDESIRCLLENFMKLPKNLDTWRRLHCRAYRLYGQWVEEYSKYADFYRQKLEWHVNRLKESGFSITACAAQPMQNNSQI
jgi:hypothetical protein